MARSCARPGSRGIGRSGKAAATSSTISPTVSSDRRSRKGRGPGRSPMRRSPLRPASASADSASESSSACSGLSSSNVSASQCAAAGSSWNTDPWSMAVSPSVRSVTTIQTVRTATVAPRSRRSLRTGHPVTFCIRQPDYIRGLRGRISREPGSRAAVCADPRTLAHLQSRRARPDMVACRPAPVRGLRYQRVRAIRRERPATGPWGRQESAAMQAPMGRRSPPRWRVRNACTAMPSTNLVRLLRARYPTDGQGRRRRDVGRWLLRRHVRGERSARRLPPEPSRREARSPPGSAVGESHRGRTPARRGDLQFHPRTDRGIWRPPANPSSSRGGRAPRDSRPPVGRRRVRRRVAHQRRVDQERLDPRNQARAAHPLGTRRSTSPGSAPCRCPRLCPTVSRCPACTPSRAPGTSINRRCRF